MSAWTINNETLDDLDVENIVFSINNQDEDYAEIRLPKNFDAALPSIFQVGSQVVIRYGSTIVFQGEIDNPSIHASGAMEYHSVFVYGPWHRFAQMPFLYMYPYVTGAEKSTHGVIGGNANSLLTTILQTNEGDFFQIGTIDVGDLTIPETEVYDQTLAETLQSILRFIPGAQVCFFYSSTPPTMHILADNSASLLTVPIDATAGTCSNLNLSPLYNRLVDGVTIQYEASGEQSLGTQSLYQPNYFPTLFTDVDTISSPISASGFFILGTDSAGDSQSRRHFRKTIRLEGAYDVSNYVMNGQLWPYIPNLNTTGNKPMVLNDLLHFTPQAGTNRYNKLLMVDRIMFFRVFHADIHSSFVFDLGASTNASAANAGVVSVVSEPAACSSNWRPLMRIGNKLSSADGVVSYTPDAPNDWVWSEFKTVFNITAGALGLRWDFTNTAGVSGYTSSSLSGHETVFVDPTTCGSVNSYSGRFTKVATVNNTSSVIPASGIAAQILASNSRLLYDGGLTLLLEENPTRFFGRWRKATIAPLGVSTLIQRFTLDVTTGLCNLTFGAPAHLGPQDLITLLRAGTPA